MNQIEIDNTLDKCLLTDEEMAEDWTTFKDTLPEFNSEDRDESDLLIK